MLRFFRFNDPYRLLVILVIMIAMALPFVLQEQRSTVSEIRGFLVGEAINEGGTMYSEVFDATPPLTAVMHFLICKMSGRSVYLPRIFSFLALFLQACLLGLSMVRFKAYNESSYLPALLFGVLCFFSFGTLSFSGELAGSLVLLLALNNLFGEIEFKTQRDESILNLGVYLGLATLFVGEYIVFFPASLIILLVFARMGLRKYLLLIFGFGLPHSLLVIIYFHWGKLDMLWRNYYEPGVFSSLPQLIDWKSLSVLLILPAVYLLFSFIMMTRNARLTKYQSQLLQVMFIWLGFALLGVLFSKQRTPQSFLVCFPALAYFFNHYLLLIRRKWIGEIMLYLFIAGVLIIGQLAWRGRLVSVNYSLMFPALEEDFASMKGRRILLLADKPGVFQSNQAAGFFLEWQLSKEVFQNPEVYQNLSLIISSFEKDLPEVIIDPANLMPAVFKLIPTFAERYYRDGTVYTLITTDSVSN